MSCRAIQPCEVLRWPWMPPQPLDRVKKPRLAADGEVEAAVAVGHDVEAGGLLRIDDARDGVEVLLAEHRITERRLEGASIQALVEPQRARIRSGDRRRQHQIARDLEHRLFLRGRAWRPAPEVDRTTAASARCRSR